ncbi:MAG TPA: (Fe-S)-binding protein [Micromonosporaceae bacterium]|jgi:L-lactate dehydrogenase complex protein LldE
MRIALFITCFNDALYPGTGRSVVTLLRRLGCEVDFPEAQTCCGQMHFNTGYRPEAAALAKRFVDVFAGYDAVVSPSPSCVGMVRDHYATVGAGDVNVYELSEFLVDVLGVTDVGATFPHRVTYHPTCHSLRGLRVGDRPLRLLRAVSGLELVELPSDDACCGFGGTFAVKNVDVSEAMLADKMAATSSTGAEVLCALDNSCLMHIGGGLSRAGSPVRVMHLADILAATS